MATKTNHFPTVDEFNSINAFASSVLDVQRVLGLLDNHFELLKRVGDTDDISSFCYSLIEFYENEVSLYRDKLPLTNDDK